MARVSWLIPVFIVSCGPSGGETQGPLALMRRVAASSDGAFRLTATMLESVEDQGGAAARDEAAEFLGRAGARFKDLLGKTPDPRKALRDLFAELDLRAEGGPRPAVPLLLWVARSRRGDCAALTCFALCVLERSDVSASFVCLPYHCFVRLRTGEAGLNFETTDPGSTERRTDEHYLERYGAGRQAIQKSAHLLKDLTPRLAALHFLMEERSTALAKDRGADLRAWAKACGPELLRMTDLALPLVGPDCPEVAATRAQIAFIDILSPEERTPEKLSRAAEWLDRWYATDPRDPLSVMLSLTFYYEIRKDFPQAARIVETSLPFFKQGKEADFLRKVRRELKPGPVEDKR